MKQIYLLKLYRGPMYLPPVVRERTLSPTVTLKDVLSWWINGKKAFKKSVLKKRTVDENIEAVGYILTKLSDVTIFSHEYNEKYDKHTNPQVVPNEDIKEIISLKIVPGVPKIGEMVISHWEDASHNVTPLSTETVKDWDGIMDITQLGFLIHKNSKRVYMGGSKSLDLNTYRYVGAVPTRNIIKMQRLTTL